MNDIFRSQFRLPVELADKLRISAEDAGRSMNAEVVARLEGSFVPENDPGMWGHFVTMIRDNLSQHGARNEDEVAQLVHAIDGLLFFLQNPLAPQPEDAVDALFSAITKKPAK